MNARKLFSTKTFAVFLLFWVLLSWGISHAVNNDIKSATTNFSATGIVSDVSEFSMTIENAKGSTQSSDGTYNLNLDYLKKVETSDYGPLALTDIKAGDKVVVQGLTNGYAFYIKRIVSFTSVATKADDENATSTATTTTSTTTEVVSPVIPAESTSTATTTTSTTTEVVSPVIPAESTSTATTAPAATEETASSTPTIIETITNTVGGAVGDVIDKVTEAVQNVVDILNGPDAPDATLPKENIVPAVSTSPSVEPPTQSTDSGAIINSEAVPVN